MSSDLQRILKDLDTAKLNRNKILKKMHQRPECIIKNDSMSYLLQRFCPYKR